MKIKKIEEPSLSLIERVELLKRSKKLGLDEKMEALRVFGEPRLCFLKNKWFCRVDVFISSKGCSFSIDSEFDPCKTTHAAVDKCILNVIYAMEKLGA